MADTRRDFIKNMALIGFFAPATPLDMGNMAEAKRPTFKHLDNLPQDDESFWRAIQESFLQSPVFTNLENGYFCSSPLPVITEFTENVRMINAHSSYYMRNRQADDRETVRKTLAEFAEVDAGELALVRNTTEGMNIVIQGLLMKKGDEIVYTIQDYGSMQETLKYRAGKEGIVVKAINLPLNPKTDDEIVKAFEAAITKKTRLLHVTHMINTTGQILPVKKLCEMARTKGVEVVVDGAHTFAHIDFKISELGCDYYAASLHKWLCNPLGSGMLWMKKEKIEKLRPLFGDITIAKTDIRRFEHYGTHQNGVQITLPASIKFHNLIGSKRKEERLRYLKNYWADQLKNISGITFNTPDDPQRSCAIANVAVKGYTPTQLAKKLYDDFKVFTVGIESETVNGVRVTPHLYTTEQHLDKLVEALVHIAKA